MDTSFQAKSVRRKIVYFVCIIVLLTSTIVLRGAGSISLGPGFIWSGLEHQSKDLELRDQDVGEVELTSSAVRLSLTGSRGLVVCYLWIVAKDKQMKHEWNELELIVRSVTKLQPHFMSPWLFQSWNLAYNVSVEADQVKDKYFYVTRGMNLLAEGERINREQPDLRLFMGTCYNSKFGYADESTTLRALLALSCIDPLHRYATKLRIPGTKQVDMEKFDEFCRAHPRLVRRLKEPPGKSADAALAKTPEDVVEFLEKNWRIPSRFEDIADADQRAGMQSTPLKKPEDRFPILPPVLPKEPFARYSLTNDDVLGDDFDNFSGSLPWFAYAQDPYPRRVPQRPTTIIFLGYPGRAQAYHAEYLEKEGWFDESWELPDWFAGKTVKVGEGQARENWEKAHELYLHYGRGYGADLELLMTPEELARASPQRRSNYEGIRTMTNYAHFLALTGAERTPEAVTARKFFHRADRYRKLGERSKAIDAYEDPAAFGPPASWRNDKATGWRAVLLSHPDYLRDATQREDLFETQHKYMGLLQELWGARLKPLLVIEDFGTQTCGLAGTGIWLPSLQLVRKMQVPFEGPFDGATPSGEPFIRPENRSVVLNRMR